MNRRIIFLVGFILLFTLVASGCGDEEESYEINRLFDEVYYKLVNDNRLIKQDQLEDFLDKQEDYDIEYKEEELVSYIIRDKLVEDENHVYVALSPTSDLIDNVSYYDGEKEVQVGLYNGSEDKDRKYHNFTIHVLGDPKERVKGVRDQIDFLESINNE